jgi:hypothetical protein
MKKKYCIGEITLVEKYITLMNSNLITLLAHVV